MARNKTKHITCRSSWLVKPRRKNSGANVELSSTILSIQAVYPQYIFQMTMLNRPKSVNNVEY